MKKRSFVKNICLFNPEEKGISDYRNFSASQQSWRQFKTSVYRIVKIEIIFLDIFLYLFTNIHTRFKVFLRRDYFDIGDIHLAEMNND